MGVPREGEKPKSLMALQRTSLPSERPTGRKLEEIKSQLLRMPSSGRTHEFLSFGQSA